MDQKKIYFHPVKYYQMKTKNRKIICFDIDGVVCSQVKNGDYENAKPNKKSINLINKLFKKKYKIILFTSRFMGRTKGNAKLANKIGYKFTYKQIKKWNLNFHKLIMGKPSYDLIIDDKSYNFKSNWSQTLKKKLLKN